MKNIKLFDTFITERHDITISNKALRVADEWLRRFKEETEAFYSRYFRIIKFGDRLELYRELNWNSHLEDIEVEGIPILVCGKGGTGKYAHGEYLPDTKRIHLFDDAISTSLRGLRDNARWYLDPDSKPKERQTAKLKAAGYIETIRNYDMSAISKTLHHEVIHKYDDEQWLGKSVVKMQSAIDRNIKPKSKTRTQLDNYIYSNEFHKFKNNLYYNSNHETNAYFRGFVSDFLKAMRDGKIASEIYHDFPKFRQYCIDTFDLRRDLVSPKNQRVIDKRLYSLFQEINDQQNESDSDVD